MAQTKVSSSCAALAKSVPRLIDIAVNLTDGMFRGVYRGSQKHQDDYDLVLKRAAVAGVERLIVTGTNLHESACAIEAVQHSRDIANAASMPKLYATVGCHPTCANEYNENQSAEYAEKLVNLIETANKNSGAPVVVAVGECGLDFDRLSFCSKERQFPAFKMQFEVARRTNLPMFLHSRNTQGDFEKVVEEHRQMFKTGVVHSFTGTKEDLQRMLDLDLYVGVNGCSLKTQENLEVVKLIPSNRLMIETDAPWCEIRPTHASHEYLKSNNLAEQHPIVSRPEKFAMGSLVRGRNEPCRLPEVLHALARIRNEDAHLLAETVYNNAMRVFF